MQHAAPRPKEWKPVLETTFQKIGESNIKCTNCDRVQFSGNKTCNRCGARFIGYEQ